MRTAACWFFLFASVSCTRVDPLYCGTTPNDAPCTTPGMVCLIPQHVCGFPNDMGQMQQLDFSTSNTDGPAPDLAMACATDSVCAARDPKTPACVAGRCQPCTRNFQCPGAACDLDGTCHNPAAVLTVNDDLAVCGKGGSPYCSVQDAMVDVGPGKDVVLLLASKGEGITKGGSAINISKSVRLVGARANAAAAPVVLLDPISISNPPGPIAVGVEDLEVSPRHSGTILGIFCAQTDPAKTVAFTLRWSKVDQAQAGALLVQSCSPVTLLSNQLVHNGGLVSSFGGAVISTQDLTLLNNVIANNGGSALANLAAGISLPMTPPAVNIAFNTVVNNDCNKPPCNLKCGQAAPMSYMISTGDGSVSAACNLSRSVVPGDYTATQMDIKITPDFVDPNNFDYHPQATDKNKMLLIQDAMPPVGFDLDGNPRPGTGGVSMGAYQLP